MEQVEQRQPMFEERRQPMWEEVNELTSLLRSNEQERARDLVREVLRRGVRVERIVTDLLAPTATRIGELWDQDQCSFLDVTVILSRLQYLVRDLSAWVPAQELIRRHGRLAVLSNAPGELHTFGLVLVEELLRRAGWDVLYESPTTVIDQVRTRFVTVLAFTATMPERYEALAALIKRAREASNNRNLVVMVGGQCFSNDPATANAVGAHTMATTASDAAQVLRTFVDRLMVFARTGERARLLAFASALAPVLQRAA